MPTTTDIKVSPYFDDFDNAKAMDYYRLLFKPGVAVQARELNQLQSMLQEQIETFGEQVLKKGTIVEGCEARFETSVPYIKLTDTTVDGAAHSMAVYKGLTVTRESSNLSAVVIDFAVGYQAQDPDLNTLYLDYNNSGNDGEQDTFANGQIVVISNPDQGLESVVVDNASTRFANSDSVVILAQFEIQNTSGGTEFASGEFEAGGTIEGVTSGATLEIITHSDTVKDGYRVISVKPLTSQLITGNTDSWTFIRGESVIDTSTTPNAEATFVEWSGGGATAVANTTATGQINNIEIVDRGEGYYIDPYVTIASLSATATDVNTLALIPRRYVAKCEIAGDSFQDPVGVSYGMSISEGTIFQKGYFSRVNEQFRIISKYSNTQSNIQVGFSSIEAISNSSIDSNLVDNASGFLNENAPGADRLVITPVLTVYTDSEAEDDDEFLGIWKFSEGKLVQESPKSTFSDVGDEMATRTFEESGNYVIDPFQINTRSTVNIANSAQFFDYIIDPGHAYINGYRVKTNRNTVLEVEKARDTAVFPDKYFDLEYGNFLFVNDYAGTIDFKLGDVVELHSVEANACSNYSDGNITTPNQKIGTAKVRSLVYDGGGAPGSPSARYRIYLFDIIMDLGQSFELSKSIYYADGTRRAAADIILEAKPGISGSGANVAIIQNPEFNSLLVNTNLPLATANNITYDYRTHTPQVEIQTTGVGTVSATDNFYYTGSLTTSQERELIVVPEEHIYLTSNLAGTFASYTSNVITGSTTTFTSELEPNDWIFMNDGADTVWLRVVSVLSDTTIQIDSTQGVPTAIAAGTQIQRGFPKNVPVDMTRSGISSSVASNVLTVDFPSTNAIANVSITYNQRIVNTGLKPKTVNRGVFVKLDMSTHPDGVNGPWCLGIPDVFRLRAVYDGSTTSDDNITDNFYIDNNHTENFIGLSYLYKNNSSNYTIGASDVLLVEFDVLTSDVGCKTISSYPLDDDATLTAMIADGTVMNTLEIPEFTGRTGDYYDMRECLDFRPSHANTVALVTSAGSAPTNPSEASSSDPFDASYTDLKFPVPESDIYANFSYYTPRTDTIVLNSDGTFDILKGESIKLEDTDPNTLILFGAEVPPYPSLPAVLSDDMNEILNRRVGTDNDEGTREDKFQISTLAVEDQIESYTMHEIGQLERRIEALEYYMNLSETEDEVKNKKLTSSIDSTLERFKFGFFVENFVDDEYTDEENKEHRSQIYESAMTPRQKSVTLEMRPATSANRFNDGQRITFPWTMKRVITQRNATNGPVIVPPPPPPPPPPIPNTPPPPPPLPPPPVISVTKITCKGFKEQTKKWSKSNEIESRQVYEGNVIKLSSNTDAEGQLIEIKFDVYGGNDRLVIYQGNTRNPAQDGTVIANTSSMTVGGSSYPKLRFLTSDEKKDLNNQSYARIGLSRKWSSSPNFTRVSHPVYGANYWIRNSGIIEIKYDMSKGQYLEVRNYKASPLHRYVVCWPGSAEQITTSSKAPVRAPTNPRPVKVTPPVKNYVPGSGVVPPPRPVKAPVIIVKPKPPVQKIIRPICSCLCIKPKIDKIVEPAPKVYTGGIKRPVTVPPPPKPPKPPVNPPPVTISIPGFGSFNIPKYTLPPAPPPRKIAPPVKSPVITRQPTRIPKVVAKPKSPPTTTFHGGSLKNLKLARSAFRLH